MAKANVHTASREELIEAGVRAEHAEEILKLRRKGKVDIDALDALPGVGPVTLEQLRQSLDFSDKAPSSGNGDDRTAKGTDSSVKVARQAESHTEQTAEVTGSVARNAAEVTRSSAKAAAQVTSIAARTSLETIQRTVDATTEVGRETVSRATAGTTDLNQLLVDLWNEQARHNLEAMTAFSRAVDWGKIVEVQSQFVRTSFERIGRMNRGYVEAVQAMMTAAASTAKNQAKRAV